MQCKKCKNELCDGWKFCPACGAEIVIEGQKKPNKRSRANGTGTAYKRGKTWQVEVRVRASDSGRLIKRTKGGFRTKTEALAYVPVLKGAPLEKPRTLSDYYATWSGRAMERLSDSKQTAYRIAWSKLQPVALSDIKTLSVTHLQSVIDEKAPSYYPARDMRVLLSHLYKLAMADGVVSTNLAQLVALPALEESEPVPFTEIELRALWRSYEAGDGFVGYILLMIYSGMMPGELLKCRSDMIDWEQHRIVGSGLKTKKRKETPIVFPSFIEPVLRAIIENSGGPKLVHMNRDNFYEEFHAALQRAGCRDLTPYACRHTTATALAIGTNAAPSIIQQVMRHSKITTTQRYIHVRTEDAFKAVDSMQQFVGSSVGSSTNNEQKMG